MKKETEFKILKKLIEKREKDKKEKTNFNWVIKITLLAFIISFGLSFISELLLPNVNLFLGVFIVILFIFIGVIFDMVGVSIAASDEAVFHSMNTRRVKGANIAIKLKKNAEKTASFCNDVIGDICGIISGSAGVVIAFNLSSHFDLNPIITSLTITGLIAAFTIGGKALGKTIAINKADLIIYEFSKILSIFVKK